MTPSPAHAPKFQVESNSGTSTNDLMSMSSQVTMQITTTTEEAMKVLGIINFDSNSEAPQASNDNGTSVATATNDN